MIRAFFTPAISLDRSIITNWFIMNNGSNTLRICVYCASSRTCDAAYHQAARQLGALLTRQSWSIVYGGGAFGSMGALADGALAEDGKVIGIIPDFMKELEWAHSGLSELKVVEDLRRRKELMLENSDAVVALPGGSGTLEELFEAITFKRLGLYLKPIILVNTKGFFNPCLELLDRCIEERFMDSRHRAMWKAVKNPEEVIPAILSALSWDKEARSFAAV
jgi:uncharacterized protein (TIGR00730 family)